MRQDFCPNIEVLVEQHINKVLTQYRESPLLLHMIRTYLRQVGAVITSICDLPSYFDLDVAVEDQLTILGKRLGWPRCHCICSTQPLFGFDCSEEGFQSEYTMVGFCEGSSTWLDCGPFVDSSICITDDEMYRAFLKVRRYQIQNRYGAEDLTAAIQTLWGSTARIVADGNDQVIVTPGRDLSPQEMSMVQLYPRVLPLAPGISLRIHFPTGSIFGFGKGWDGFCIDAGGDEALERYHNDFILTEDGSVLLTDTLSTNAHWMCPTDVRSYCEVN